MNRLMLDKLVFNGVNKEDAIVKFAPGLNIITGPSNTGKTLIFQCINYVLGSSKKPKSPPEAKGYTTLYLTIKSGEQTFTIERDTKSSDVRIFKTDYDRISKVEPLIMSASANATDNLSNFLLGVIGVQGKKLKKNERNETVSLTFNILKNILLVGELKIQSESSPIFSGITTSETQEKALFRFLLTGADYSGIIASKKNDIRKASANAQIDLLNQLIQQSKAQLWSDSNLVELEGQLDILDRTINLEIESVTQNENEIDSLTLQRKSFWEKTIQAESKIAQLSELRSRFELLDRYYDNDLERLGAIVEAGDALIEIKSDSCPTCGSSPENHRPDCVISETQLASVVDACLFEQQKISSLKKDLASALSQVQRDIDENTTKRNADFVEYKRLDEEISSKLNPIIQLSKERMAGLYSQKQRIESSIKVISEIESLRGLLSKAQDDLKAKPRKEKAEIGLLVNESGPFIETVHATLKSWGYPELDTVHFSEIDQDVVIGEKSRSDHGKGYRALLHAAFIVALMEYCLSNNSNHPGFIVLDSPLVTFRGADPDVTAEDGISVDVKDSFFVALSKTASDRQIVVIDNDEPPAHVRQDTNYIHFTKDKKFGRFGFIPV